MAQENLESELLFHGTTHGHFDRVIHERGLYLPGARSEIYLSPNFNYALSYALQRSSEYKDNPIILAMDKVHLVECNLQGPFSSQSSSPYYTCDFLKPEWFKSYDYPTDGRKMSERDRETLGKIADDFPTLFWRSWGEYIFL